MKLFVFGIGYTAGHFVRHHAQAFDAIAGTVRGRDKADGLAREGIATFVFDGEAADAGIAPALAEADAVLCSVQPSSGRDPALDRFGAEIEAGRARRIVYLSTIGVYGDHGGAWIDETTRPEPNSRRGRERLVIEDAWLDLGHKSGKAVAVLRLAGIYGPGRNAIEDLRHGEARRLDKPGQVFNRIHVDDIGRAIAGALATDHAHGAWNVTDDEPAPAPDVVAYAATLLGIAPPPLLRFAEAELSPMARSFYGANRRVRNAALKRDLGVMLRYPTYREGLDGLLRGR